MQENFLIKYYGVESIEIFVMFCLLQAAFEQPFVDSKSGCSYNQICYWMLKETISLIKAVKDMKRRLWHDLAIQ